MTKYRKKPIVIDAMEWTGDNVLEIVDFMGEQAYGTRWYWAAEEKGTMIISTLEGNMTARAGDFIIKGVQGEYYPCKPDIFHETYEEVTYPNI